jgi:hypothetical protein
MTTDTLILKAVTFHHYLPISRADIQNEFHAQLFPDEPRRTAPARNISVTLTWSTKDPHVIGFLFSVKGNPEWRISRELLMAGLDGVSGDPSGDVQMFPDIHDASGVELVVSSPSGIASFRILREELEGFLSETFEHVPLCGEVIPDALFDELIS